MLPLLALYTKQFLEIKLFTFDYHENKTGLTGYRCFIRPKVHFASEFSLYKVNLTQKLGSM